MSDYNDRDNFVEVLCGCGWGSLKMRESEVPEFCPMCGSVLRVGDDDEDSGYSPGEEMDGDAESALASAGWGTDEDYGCYGDD